MYIIITIIIILIPELHVIHAFFITLTNQF